MSFFEQNNRIYSIIFHFDPILRYLLSILFIAIIVLMWFFIFYQDLNSRQVQLVAEIADLNKKETLLTEIKHKIKNTELSINQLNFNINQTLNKSNKEISTLEAIIESADKSESSVLFCSPIDKINKDLYSHEIISFGLKGSFYQIIKFLENFETIKNLIKYKKFNIKHNDSDLYLECTCKFYSPRIGTFKCADSFLAD